MFTKDSDMDEEDLVLMETKELTEKCGNCNSKLVLKLYWSKDEYKQKIECENCGLAVWKSKLKRLEY
jgi:DNA-directed RNA polymerase subunit RPC12/RpoP